ncbi:MAG: sugar ABC transporter substrate-binding protein [Oscillospiraceae bacterium]|jgi:ribose transport system substrate-binding protein|nr:sugar ABC transporter substrate-binding protein [Oscillospiraceae bacterium]
MKKLFTLFLALALVLTSTAALADVIKIGVVTPDGDHGFTGESIAHARAELDKLTEAGEIEYKYVAGGEASKQIAGIEDLLNNWDPDVIVLWPLEGEQLRNAAQQIVDADVGLIIYDRLIEGFEGKAAEIMGDNEGIGNLMGEYLLKYFEEPLKAGEKLTYLRFIGDSSTVSVQRTKGMTDVIAASPYKDQFELIHEEFPTDWSNTKSQELFENWLNTTDPEVIKDLDFICTHDDEIVDGLTIALDAFQGEAGIKLITSVGARRETLATYDNSPIDLDTYYFSPSFIRESIRLALAYAKGEQYQGQTIAGQLFLIPTIQVDKTNVAEFRQSPEFIERYSISQ